MVADLPTGNFTILCVAGAVCVILAIFAFLAYMSDAEDIDALNDIIYFQEKIPPRDPVYIITLKVEECFAEEGGADIIMRLRGTVKDSPLILFRDHDNRYLGNGKTLSLGFSVPFDLGSLVEIDIAGDHGTFEECSPLFSVADLFIRKLPRRASALTTSKTRIMLEEKKSPFEALSNNVRTWTSVETLVSGRGLRVLGVSVPERGRSQTVRARDVALTLTLQEEAQSRKVKAKIGFLPLHYIWSLSSSWHDAWSEFSRLDLIMVMCLDLLASMVLASTCYAYGLEILTGITYITPLIVPSDDNTGQSESVTSVEGFDLLNFATNLRQYVIPLMHIAWITLLSNTVVIPISLVWCRLFRLIGGKGFEKALNDAQPPQRPDAAKYRQSPVDAPQASAAHCDDGGDGENLPISPEFLPNLMLRVLECKSTHTVDNLAEG